MKDKKQDLPNNAEVNAAIQKQQQNAQRDDIMEAENKKSISWLLDNLVFMPDKKFCLATNTMYTNQGFNDTFYSRCTHYFDGDKLKTVLPINSVRDHQDRKAAVGVGWEPVALGSDKLYQYQGQSYVNEYMPLSAKGIEGDVSLYLELVNYMCGEYAELVLDHMAFTLQHPDKKIIWQVFIFGKLTRNGKSSVVKPLQHILENLGQCNSVPSEQLKGAFDDAYVKTKMIVMQEVYGYDKAVFNTLKNKLANTDYEKLNVKSKAMIVQKNLYSIYLFSNHVNAMKMDVNEGKLLAIHAPEHFIYDSVGQAMSEKSSLFYSDLHDQLLHSENGKNALLYYLLNRDVSNFQYGSPAPITDALKEACVAAESDYVEHIMDLYQDLLKPFDRHGFTISDLRTVVGSGGATGIKDTLEMLGFVKVKAQNYGHSSHTGFFHQSVVASCSNKDLWHKFDTPFSLPDNDDDANGVLRICDHLKDMNL